MKLQRAATFKKPRYAGVFSGANYLSCANPVGLDLSGAEMITDAESRTFATTKGNWVDGGNHTAVRDTSYKKSGAASLKITATAAGDSTTNNESLPFANFATIVSGNKFCKQLWAYGNTNGVTLAMTIGDQTVTGKVVYNATPGTFVQVVFNFLATALTVNADVKLYASGAGDIYVDDISIRQKKDMIILTGIRSDNDANLIALNTIINISNSGAIPQLTLRSGGSGVIMCVVEDYAGLARYPVISDIDCYQTPLAITINSTGVIAGYKSEVRSATTGDMTTFGNLGSINSFRIGLRGSGLKPWEGIIFPTQFIIFNQLPADNGASIIADANNRFKAGKPFANSYAGGTIAGWWNFKNGSLLDKSGNGNHLTNNGGVVFTKIK
jgi:hypothetical protein